MTSKWQIKKGKKGFISYCKDSKKTADDKIYHRKSTAKL